MIQNEKIAISIAEIEQEILLLKPFIINSEREMLALQANIPDYKLVLAKYIETLDQLNELDRLVDCVDQSLSFADDFGGDQDD